jgi:hypothetical protein
VDPGALVDRGIHPVDRGIHPVDCGIHPVHAIQTALASDGSGNRYSEQQAFHSMRDCHRRAKT